MRQFCTAGPVQPDVYYALPPLERLGREEILALVEARKYFVLHAPRQTGKTSALLALVGELNATGRYRAMYANVEGAQSARDDVAAGMQTILSVICRRAKSHLGDPFPDQVRAGILSSAGPHDALQALLAAWCEHSPLPICLMLDEIDALVGDTLISVLRQLRAGYQDRPTRFPQSIILCGVRDVRDYRIHGAKEIITGGSAFNIKAESLRLEDFSRTDVRRLYEQHTGETGQRFEEAVYPLVWELTQGQPLLVNALAHQVCFKLQKDRSKPITPELIQEAKENLILERVTHLDQLADKLKEPRVQRVIEPIVQGDDEAGLELMESDDAQYLIDLGLIRVGPAGLEISNGIYREVIPRELNYRMQVAFMTREQTAWYVEPDGRLNMIKLFEAFQQFYRENSESWIERYEYKEAAPQLILQAFLQRIVNSGGRIDREYALGRRRADLLVMWNHPGGVQREVIEIKLVRGTLEKTVAEGLRQIAGYMDSTGAKDAHLVVFNRTPNVSWDERIYRRDERLPDGRLVVIWGM